MLRFEDGGEVDLREPIEAAARERFERAGLRGRFVVLSAYPAPTRERRDDGELATNRLRVVIAAFGCAPIAVLARAAAGPHTEPSVAAELERDVALRIARLFEQAAQFWFDGERMWIDWTDGRPSTELPEPRSAATFRVSALRAERDESGGH